MQTTTNQTPEEMEEQGKILLEQAAQKRAELAAQAKSSKRIRKPVDMIDFEDMDVQVHKKLNEILDKEDMISSKLDRISKSEPTEAEGYYPHGKTKENNIDEFDDSDDFDKSTNSSKYFEKKQKRKINPLLMIISFVGIVLILIIILIVFGVL